MENNFIQMAASAGHAVAYQFLTTLSIVWYYYSVNGNI